MSDFIHGIDPSLLNPAKIPQGIPEGVQRPQAGEFKDLITSMLKDVEATNTNADKAVQSLVAGEAKDIHSVMVAVHQADLSLRLALEIRNKLVDAYKEIMRMSG